MGRAVKGLGTALVCVSDCRSLVDYVSSNVPAKTQDKRLGIELTSKRQSVWDEQNQRTCNRQGGDKVEWTATATMPADCLTKSMKPTYLLKILRERAGLDCNKQHEKRAGPVFSTCCTRRTEAMLSRLSRQHQ